MTPAVEARAASPLEGAYNFRDLGGLPLADGRRTRHGLLFRSDTLQAVTAGDLALLRGRFDLRAVVDLRLAAEAAGEGRGPLAGAPEVAYVNAPFEMAATEGIAPDQVLTRLYRACLDADSLPAVLAQIAARAGQPTVFHCAAGKDRTGIVAAIVLALVGVAEEAIVADYLASAANMPRIRERFRTWPRYRDHMAAMPPGVYDVDAAPLRFLLRVLDEEYGGVQRWAARRGVPAAVVATLARHLVAG